MLKGCADTDVLKAAIKQRFTGTAGKAAAVAAVAASGAAVPAASPAAPRLPAAAGTAAVAPKAARKTPGSGDGHARTYWKVQVAEGCASKLTPVNCNASINLTGGLVGRLTCRRPAAPTCMLLYCQTFEGR